MFEVLTDQEIDMLKLKLHNGRERIWEIDWPVGFKTAYINTATDATRLIDELWGIRRGREWRMSKPEAPEFQIERDYDARCAHARSMYHMAVQRAETELDLALGIADEIRQGQLADLRHKQHEPVTPTLEDVIAVTRMADLP